MLIQHPFLRAGADVIVRADNIDTFLQAVPFPKTDRKRKRGENSSQTNKTVTILATSAIRRAHGSLKDSAVSFWFFIHINPIWFFDLTFPVFNQARTCD